VQDKAVALRIEKATSRPARNRGRRVDDVELASCSSCTSFRWSAPGAETLSSSQAPVLRVFRPSRREQTDSTPNHSDTFVNGSVPWLGKNAGKTKRRHLRSKERCAGRKHKSAKR